MFENVEDGLRRIPNVPFRWGLGGMALGCAAVLFLLAGTKIISLVLWLLVLAGILMCVPLSGRTLILTLVSMLVATILLFGSIAIPVIVLLVLFAVGHVLRSRMKA